MKLSQFIAVKNTVSKGNYLLLRLSVFTLAASVLTGCILGEGKDVHLFNINEAEVFNTSFAELKKAKSLMYADQYASKALANDTTTLWLTRDSVSTEAVKLMNYLRYVTDEGISPTVFNYALIEERLDTLSQWIDDGRTNLLTDAFAVELETALTQALMRYAYGQRYGYVRPHKIFNNLLVDGDAADKTKRTYRQLFDLNCDQPTDSLAQVALNCVRQGTLDKFLASIQPDNSLHKALVAEYRNAVANGDTAQARLARINLERSRWRYDRPGKGRYVFVNLASQMLTAVDTKGDSCIEMRICCGNQGHKSPMLSSKISYMEFNPYWVVPMSIIRNEIIKSHLHDGAYFSRNRMFAINNSTKDTINPASLTADQWKSGVYTLKQDKGRGNSLGRIIFRFPNNFAVYLHDTNQPGVFKNANRAVSHGCVRVQRPMDLAVFLLGDKADKKLIDHMRITVDMAPLTPAGKKMKEDEVKPLNSLNVRPAVPVWIDYYTLYPDTKGVLHCHGDPYGYDKALEKALKPLF